MFDVYVNIYWFADFFFPLSVCTLCCLKLNVCICPRVHSALNNFLLQSAICNLSIFFFSFFALFLSIYRRITKKNAHTYTATNIESNNLRTTRTNRRRLRTELQLIRHKGAIKINGGIGGGSLDRPNIETYLSCARCCTELGRIINRGAPCRVCRLRVCKGCREFSTRTTDWVCIVCHKQMWVSFSFL